MSGEPEEARWAGLRGRAREEGLRLPTLGRGGARGEGRRGARVFGEHWCGGSESLVGSPGPRWGWGHCWRTQIPFLLSFVIWWGRQVHSPAWEHLMSCGWSPVCPPFLGHQVDWTDRPGSCFSLSAEGAKLRLGAERPEPRASLFPASLPLSRGGSPELRLQKDTRADTDRGPWAHRPVALQMMKSQKSDHQPRPGLPNWPQKLPSHSSGRRTTCPAWRLR